MGTASGTVVMFLARYGGGTINLGTAVETSEAYIETKALDFGDDTVVKFVEKIVPNIRGRRESPGMSLEIYGSDDEEGPFDLLDDVDIYPKEPVYIDPPGQRFYKFRFVDEAVSVRWSLHGFSVYGEVGGDEF